MKKYIYLLVVISALFLVGYADAGKDQVVTSGETVMLDGSVDTSVEGTYNITYSAINNAGNEATKVRTVNVVAPTITSITVEGNREIGVR